MKNIFWHNLGLMIYFYPEEMLQSNKDFIISIVEEWIAEHVELVTHRLRKASFLGLLTILSMGNKMNEFLPF